MSSEQTLQVVCLKRDLRLQDHAALTAAARLGPLLVLYVVESAIQDRHHSSCKRSGTSISNRITRAKSARQLSLF